MKEKVKLKYVFFIAILMFSFGVFKPKIIYATESDTVNIDVTGTLDYVKAEEVFEIVNRERAKEGLSQLKLDEALTEIAMQRAAELTIYCQHVRPDGTSCFSVFPNYLYGGGENIAAGYDTSESVMDGWMNSDGHRSNILEESFDSVGIGVFQYNGICYWIQAFGINGKYEVKGLESNITKTYTISTSINNIIPKVNNININEGDSKSLKVMCENPEWSGVYFELKSSDISFSSSDTNIAQVDSNGNIKAINEGNAKIMANVSGSAEVFEICNITVNNNLPFPDVKKTDWFYDAVRFVYKKQLMSGYSAGTLAGKFGANDNITRGQIVTILYRMDSQPSVIYNIDFADVNDTNEYYYEAVKWAAANEIVTGYKSGENAGKFLPNKPITREELAIILQRYARLKGKDVTKTADISGFVDYKDVSNWAEAGLKWTVAVGIISGNKDTTEPTIKPQGNATRAEAATMIMRFCKNVLE